MARRTVKTLNRPHPHLFAEDLTVPPDWKGTKVCRCQLPERDEVHRTASELAADLPEAPPEQAAQRGWYDPNDEVS
jgi:hypothetical protein